MTSITEKVGPWIDEVVEEMASGENILWEPALLPGPEGGPLYTVVVWMPGAVLGTVINGSFQIGDILGIDQESLSETVRQFIRQVREARSQQIAENTPPPRGSQTPSGLLIG